MNHSEFKKLQQMTQQLDKVRAAYRSAYKTDMIIESMRQAIFFSDCNTEMSLPREAFSYTAQMDLVTVNVSGETFADMIRELFEEQGCLVDYETGRRGEGINLYVWEVYNKFAI